jgi:hypothetical protein
MPIFGMPIFGIANLRHVVGNAETVEPIFSRKAGRTFPSAVSGLKCQLSMHRANTSSA